MFEGQPKGLYALALANTGERFGYYTMLAVFALFLRANFGLEAGVAGTIYSTFLGLIYFTLAFITFVKRSNRCIKYKYIFHILEERKQK